MKKVLTTLLFMLAIGANAQINDLDEIEIQGKWDVYGFGGSFSNIPFEYRLGNTPKYLELKDGNYTHLYFPNNDWMFKGYWLSCAQTGKYILHLLPWNSESVVNFVVTKFDDGLLHLSTYDEKGWIELRKSDTDDIENVSVDTSKTNTKTYNLNGVEVNENTKGIVISKGKKQLK